MPCKLILNSAFLAFLARIHTFSRSIRNESDWFFVCASEWSSMMKNSKSIELNLEKESSMQRRNAKLFGILRKFHDKREIYVIFLWDYHNSLLAGCLPKSTVLGVQLKVSTITQNCIVFVRLCCKMYYVQARTLAVTPELKPHKITNIIALMD